MACRTLVAPIKRAAEPLSGGSMIGALKRFMVGRPIETAAQHEQRLSKRIALAVFSSDALSSVAYASEAILVVLVTAGVGALPLVIEISLGIALLLLIVGFSYR